MRKKMRMKNGSLVLMQRIFALVLLLLWLNGVYAQKASTIVSKEKIVLGEQITVKIQVDNIVAADVQQDFSFPDTINHLEILSDSIDKNGPSYIHTLTITSFDSGYWQLPSYEMILSGNRKISTQAVNITVLPVDVSSLADYHDIKDILDVNYENNWWIIAGIVLVALLSLFAFLWFATNKLPQRESIASSSDLAHLYNDLMKKIGLWENETYTERAAIVSLFKETSLQTRAFMDAAYQQRNIHLTSGEFMLRTRARFPDSETEKNYFQFLRLADAVKFAKYIPPQEEITAIFVILRQTTEQVYQQNKSNG